jgi:hypothetical protein
MPRTLSSVNHLRQAVLNRPQPLSACSPIRPVGVQCVLWRSQVGMRLAPGVLEFLIILTWDNGRRSDCFRASRIARDETATVALQSFVVRFFTADVRRRLKNSTERPICRIERAVFVRLRGHEARDETGFKCGCLIDSFARQISTTCPAEYLLGYGTGCACTL